MIQLLFINRAQEAIMCAFEQSVAKNSATPRSFSMICDETASQGKNHIHSICKCQKSILDSDITFWSQSKLCLTKVVENAAAALLIMPDVPNVGKLFSKCAKNAATWYHKTTIQSASDFLTCQGISLRCE